MTVTVPFVKFSYNVATTNNYAVDCGELIYDVTQLSLVPDDPDSIIDAQVFIEAIVITIDRTLIPDGLNATFGLTGFLKEFQNINHNEKF